MTKKFGARLADPSDDPWDGLVEIPRQRCTLASVNLLRYTPFDLPAAMGAPASFRSDTQQAAAWRLYRFTGPGARQLTGGATAAPACSLDGGNSKLADCGQSSDSSDFLNSGVQGRTIL
jgi:hypothetical protein